MLGHLFRYRLKCLIRNRPTLFWTLLFPLFMATAFYAAFGQMLLTATPEPIAVAVVDSPAYRLEQGLQQVISALAEPGESQLLQLTLVSETEATDLLRQEQVVGIISVDEQGPLLRVNRSGISETVLKAVLDEYRQTASTVHQLLADYPQAALARLPQILQRTGFTVATSFSDADPNLILNYFYALIAMTCLSGSYWGLINGTQTQANLSAHGVRRSVAPTPKSLIVLTDTAAALLIAFGEVLILLAYLALVLQVSFGTQLPFILLVCFLGSLNGVALGTLVGTAFRHSESVKYGILIGLTLSLSFLAGLMFMNMKDIVMRYAPVLSYLNPAALITDAFYSLYIFSGHQRFFLNVGLLATLTMLFCLGSFWCLRGERYASI